MDKTTIHEIENYLHHVISYAENIAKSSDSPTIFEYALKIKNSAYSIDALISDSTAKKEKVEICQNSLDSVELEQFMGMKIMIVDDLDENIYIMKNIFDTFSCEIVSAKSGEEALEVYKSGFSPDIVCMDIIMPGVDGSQATKQLRALGCNAFFMAVSALKNQSNEVVSVFDAWLPKPFTIEHIIGALIQYKTTWHVEIKNNEPDTVLELSDDIKKEVLQHAQNGAYTALKTLTNEMQDSPSKIFLQESLKKMNFNAIVKSIVSS